MNYFHQKGITHRDLKLENLLVNGEFDVKIADFGFAAFTNRTLSEGKAGNLLTDNIGTRGYKAPEIDNADQTFGS